MFAPFRIVFCGVSSFSLPDKYSAYFINCILYKEPYYLLVFTVALPVVPNAITLPETRKPMSTSPQPGQPEPNQQYEQWQQEHSGTAYPQWPSTSQPLGVQTSYAQSQQYQQQPSQPQAMMPIQQVRPQKSTGRIALWITVGIFIGLVIGYPVGQSAANNHTSNALTLQPGVVSAQLTATDVAFQQTAVAASNSWMTQIPTLQPTSAPQTVNRIGDTLSNSVWESHIKQRQDSYERRSIQPTQCWGYLPHR